MKLFDKSIDRRGEVIRYHIKFCQDALAVWNGRRVITYEYSADKSSIKAAGKLIWGGGGALSGRRVRTICDKQVLWDWEKCAVSIFFITGTFTTETMNVCLHEQNVYCIEAMKVQVRTHQVKTESFLRRWINLYHCFPLALTICKIYKILNILFIRVQSNRL